MKRSHVTFVSTLILLLTLASTSFAQIKTPVVKNRQITQQKKITQGIRSGELTRVEVKKLEKQQSRIQYAKMVAKSDGRVTKKERIKLDKMQDKANKQIYRLKHNNRDRS